MSDCSGIVNLTKPSLDIEPELGGKQRRKKFTGGNASKRHRDRVNIEFNNLAKLLPFSDNVIAKLDKSSILRLAVSYIRAKSFFKDISVKLTSTRSETCHPVPVETGEKLPHFLPEGSGLLSDIFTHALDGFLLVLTEDMKVLFVSESVREHLGYCQAGIIHENFLQFVNPSDEKIVKSSLLFQADELDSESCDSESKGKTYIGDPLSHGLTSRGSIQRVARRQFSCRMKCAFSCRSRFYTAYRSFDFTGHLRRSSIQEGREEKILNTLVVLGTAVNNNSAPLKLLPSENESDLSTTEEGVECVEKVHSGFRIEPTLRPHIAPIPVTSQELAIRRTQNQSCTNSSKTRQPPSLISADVYNRQSFLLANNIKTYRQNGYSICSVDSRYSDHSDDSKCSPVASPNLLWKQNHRRSPVYDVCTFKNSVDDELYRSDKLQKLHGNFLEKRFSYNSYGSTAYKEKRSDVYEGASMLMNLRYRESSLSPDSFIQYRKRTCPDVNVNVSCKRSKSNSPNKSSFNISSLLGMEDQKTGRKSPYHERFIDVCTDDETSENNVPFKDMIHSMSRRLDDTFRKTMSAV